MEDSWLKGEILDPICAGNIKISDVIKILERRINDIHRILYAVP
jgi:hypothetical protein